MDKGNLARVSVQSEWSISPPSVELTIAAFFCSSLGLLSCESLGPMEGSTPFKASSSNSTRSTSLSPYVKNLNYNLINDAHTAVKKLNADLPRILRRFSKLCPQASGFSCCPVHPSAHIFCLRWHLKVIIDQWGGSFRVSWVAHRTCQW